MWTFNEKSPWTMSHVLSTEARFMMTSIRAFIINVKWKKKLINEYLPIRYRNEIYETHVRIFRTFSGPDIILRTIIWRHSEEYCIIQLHNAHRTIRLITNLVILIRINFLLIYLSVRHKSLFIPTMSEAAIWEYIFLLFLNNGLRNIYLYFSTATWCEILNYRNEKFTITIYYNKKNLKKDYNCKFIQYFSHQKPYIHFIWKKYSWVQYIQLHSLKEHVEYFCLS